MVEGGMNQNRLFELGLGLSAPWKVVRRGLEEGGAGSKFLSADIGVEPGSRMPCPCCGKLCGQYDHEVKRWRHLNFRQHFTYLSARVPRVECPEHGVRQVAVPWARPESGFTVMFEAFVMALAREMPVAAVAELVAGHDRDGGVRDKWRQENGRAVCGVWCGIMRPRRTGGRIGAGCRPRPSTRRPRAKGTATRRWWWKSIPTRNSRRGSCFMTRERSAASAGQFVEAMPAHGARPGQVQMAAIDMSAAYRKGVREYLPDARMVFDRFHVMQLAGHALDEVRKQLQAGGCRCEGGALGAAGQREPVEPGTTPGCARISAPGTRNWAGPWRCARTCRETWAWPGAVSAGFHLKAWCSWAVRSRLAPFKKLAQTIKSHWEGILAYFPHRITSAAIESINAIIQTARRRARGFRNFENLKAISYWMAGHPDLQIPSAFTHPI